MLGAPSRLASQSTIAPLIRFSLPLLVTIHWFWVSNLERTSISLVFLCLFSAKKGGSLHIVSRVLSLDIICQLFLRMDPMWMVVLSYGIMNGRCLLFVSLVCFLCNNSLWVSFSTFLNCVYISERFYPLLSKLSLRMPSFSLKFLLSVMIRRYRSAWL